MAKRVNTRFLIIITVVTGCLIVAAYGAHLAFFRKDPMAQARAGDALMLEGKPREALEKYKYAIVHDPTNKDLLVKVGDAYNALVSEDTYNLGQARGHWAQAVAHDPRYEPALERLLDSFWQDLETASLDGELYGRVQETAKRLAEARPADTGVAAKVHISTIRPWLDGLTQSVKRNDVDNAVKALVQLQPRDRSNGQIPYYIALARLKWAQEKWRSEGEESPEADRLAAEAGKVMDAALADQGGNAAMQLRAYEVYSMLGAIERARAALAQRRAMQQAASVVADAGEAETPSAAKARQAIAAAVEAAKELPASDPLYADIHISAARFAQLDRRPADAEKIYEELLAKRPDDQNVRIRFGELLAQTPAGREKAIQLLSADVNVSHLKGPQARAAAGLRIKTLLDLAEVRMAQARTTADARQRQAIIEQARKDLERLSSMVQGESWEVLRARGRLQQLQGEHVASIQTFQRAVHLMENSTRKDYDLVNDLAKAYLFAGQTGPAKKLLQEVIDRADWYVPARLDMAQVLIAENKLEDAKIHMTAAERQLGKLQGDPKELAVWRAHFDRTALALLSKAGDDERLEQQFAKMPEDTRQAKLNKAGIAVPLKKYDEAVRLASQVLDQDPKDAAALDVLTNALITAGRYPQAVAAFDKALAAVTEAPRAQQLKLRRDKIAAHIELAKATPQEIYERSKQLIEQEPASPERTLKLADLERHHGRPDQAEAVLLRLHAEQPAHVGALNRLFELALSRQQWDKAKGLLDKLVATKADGAGGLLYQFRFATARGDKAEAMRLAKAVRDNYPEFDLGYVAYGQALQADERWAEAYEEYRKARDRKPLNFDAVKGMIQCRYAQNQPKEARELIGEARGLFPDNSLFKDMELEHELTYGDPLNVVAEREMIHRVQPDKAENWLELAAAYRRVARLKYDNDPAKKAEVLSKARDLLRKGLERWKGDARFVTALAGAHADAGDFAAGEKLLTEYAAAEERSTQSEPTLLLADYYIRGGRAEEAEKAARSGLEKAESAGDASAAVAIRLKLADFLSQLSRHDDALAVLDAAKPAPGPAAAAQQKQVFSQRLRVLIAAGRRDVAEQKLLEELARPENANDTDLQMTLVGVNYDGGRFDQALERVDKVLKADPENIKVRFFRGQILLRKPRPDVAAAIRELEEVRKKDPNNVTTRLLLADAYRTQGDGPGAARVLEEGLRLQPLSRDLRIKLMDLRRDDGTEVLRLAREARGNIQLKDDPVWAYREAGVHARNRDWPSSIAAIQDAIKLAPRDMNLRREHQNILLLAEDYQGVLELTEPFLAQAGAAGGAPAKAPWWVYLNRGRARHGLKDAAGAVTEFNNGLNAAGDNNAAVEQIVKTMVTTVGKEEALRLVMSRADQDPRWKLLAAALYSVSKKADGTVEWDKAVAMLDEVQAHFDQLTPAQKAQALRIAGPLYQMARPPEFDKAKRAYEQLLQLEPNDLFALNNLANLLVDEALVPQPEEARKYSQRAYEQVKRAQPFPAAIFDTHGWVLIQCGSPQQVDEGIDILQKVVRQTTMPEAHYHLGEGYLKKQDPKKAVEELNMAAQVIPEAIARGSPVAPDLEKKIRSASERAKEMLRAQSGGEAGAR